MKEREKIQYASRGKGRHIIHNNRFFFFLTNEGQSLLSMFI